MHGLTKITTLSSSLAMSSSSSSIRHNRHASASHAGHYHTAKRRPNSIFVLSARSPSYSLSYHSSMMYPNNIHDMMNIQQHELNPASILSKLSALSSFLIGSGIVSSSVGLIYYSILKKSISIQEFQNLAAWEKKYLFLTQDASPTGISETMEQFKNREKKKENKINMDESNENNENDIEWKWDSEKYDKFKIDNFIIKMERAISSFTNNSSDNKQPLQPQDIHEKNFLQTNFMNATNNSNRNDDDDDNNNNVEEEEEEDNHTNDKDASSNYLYTLSQEELELEIAQLEQEIIALNHKREEKLMDVNITAALENFNDFLEVGNDDNDYDDQNNNNNEEEKKEYIEEENIEEEEGKEDLVVIDEAATKAVSIPSTEKETVESGGIGIGRDDKTSINPEGKKEKVGESAYDRLGFIEEQAVAKKGLNISKKINTLGMFKKSKNMTSATSLINNDQVELSIVQQDLLTAGSGSLSEDIIRQKRYVPGSTHNLDEEPRQKTMSFNFRKLGESTDEQINKVNSDQGSSNNEEDDNLCSSVGAKELKQKEMSKMKQVSLKDEHKISSLPKVKQIWVDHKKMQVSSSSPNTKIANLLDDLSNEKEKHSVKQNIVIAVGETDIQNDKETSENEAIAVTAGGANLDKNSPTNLISEREKRQKAMAQDLATAAFHAELQRKGEGDHKKRTQYYKNQIESDMERVRIYAAQKKLRTEVKRASDMHSNKNLFSMLVKEKKIPALEEKASLRRTAKSSFSTSTSTTTLASGQGAVTNQSNKNITMWDIVSNESKMRQGKRFTRPSKKIDSNDRGLLLMGKTKKFKTPKKPMNNQDTVSSSKKKEPSNGSTLLKKRSLVLALALVMAQRVSQIIML